MLNIIQILLRKELTPLLVSESLLSEKLTNIDADVDLLYEKYFITDIQEIEKTGFIRRDMFKPSVTNTTILLSEDSIKANALNSCEIIINQKSNHYAPLSSIISLGLNKNALEYVLYDFNGDLMAAAKDLVSPVSRSLIIKEFTEEKVKGSIHHELVHWIDDTLNNQHLTKRSMKALEAGTNNIGGIPVNSTKMEIQAQIHNIKQLYNKYKSQWDELSFDDMLWLSPALVSIDKSLNDEFRTVWRRDIKHRMNREGLLGKKMR